MRRRAHYAARSKVRRAWVIATKLSGDGTMPATYEVHVSQGGTLLSAADFASAQSFEAQRQKKKKDDNAWWAKIQANSLAVAAAKAAAGAAAEAADGAAEPAAAGAGGGGGEIEGNGGATTCGAGRGDSEFRLLPSWALADPVMWANVERALDNDLRVGGRGPRKVVRCREHGERRSECEKCSLFCGCTRRDGELRRRKDCSVHNPDAFCNCGKDGAARLRKNCSECNPDAFCNCGEDGAARRRSDCSECNPDAFCGHLQRDEKTPRLRQNCSECNPDAFCNCGEDGAARRRKDCSVHNPDAFCNCGEDGAARLRKKCSVHKKGGSGETDWEYSCYECTHARACRHCAPDGVYDVCFTRADIPGAGEARFTDNTLGMGIEYPPGAQFPFVTDPVQLAPSKAGIRAGDTICAVDGNDVQPMAFGEIVIHLRARPVVLVTFARCMTRRMEALEEAAAEMGGSDGGGGGGDGGVGDDQRLHDDVQALTDLVNGGCTKGGGLKVLHSTRNGTKEYWNDLWKKLVEVDDFGEYRVKASEGGKENPAKRQKTD
jgi:hypothetical protein